MPDAISQAENFTLELYQQGGTVQTIATSGTVNTNYGSVRVTAGAAITGVIMAPGVKPGQVCCIITEQAALNTFTMAAAGTSNVAAGVTCVLSGLNAHLFIWDATTALWYQVGPAAN
jgi:hypothetical protein